MGRADEPVLARQAMLLGSVGAAVAVAFTWAFTQSLRSRSSFSPSRRRSTAARMVAGTVFGFGVAGELGSAVGTVRGVTTQIGYLLGLLVGGLAIAVGGIGALGIVLFGALPGCDAPLRLPSQTVPARGRSRHDGLKRPSTADDTLAPQASSPAGNGVEDQQATPLTHDEDPQVTSGATKGVLPRSGAREEHTPGRGLRRSQHP